MPSQQASVRRLFALTTAFTPIPASIFTRMVELAEDGTGTGNGLAVKFPNDNFTAIFNYPPDQQPLILGDRDAHGNARGEIIGWPTQTGLNARTADVMVQVAAMSGATVLRVTEHS